MFQYSSNVNASRRVPSRDCIMSNAYEGAAPALARGSSVGATGGRPLQHHGGLTNHGRHGNTSANNF